MQMSPVWIVKLYLYSAINPLECSVAMKQLCFRASFYEGNENQEAKLKLVINFLLGVWETGPV